MQFPPITPLTKTVIVHLDIRNCYIRGKKEQTTDFALSPCKETSYDCGKGCD